MPARTVADGAPETPSASPGFQMWLVTLSWQRAVKAVLRPYGLTHVQFVLLAGTWWLSSQEGPPTQRRLAQWTGTDPMMTSQVLRRLEGKDLLTRAEDTQDTRAKRVRLTDSGQTLLLQVMPAVDAADATFFAPVSQTQLLQILSRLTNR